VFLGKTSFLGQDISKYALEYEGKYNIVLYNKLGEEIPADHMVFTFYIDRMPGGIPIELVNIVDRILLSFELVE